MVSCLGQVRGLVVADVLIERGHEHQALFHVLIDPLQIGLDAFHAKLLKHVACVRQQPRRMHEVINHHRLEDVELEIALAARKCNRRIIPVNLDGNHRHRFALGWIHLAGHNRAARFVFRQVEFTQSATRT